MDYPSQLNLDEEVERGLINWFDGELTNHFAERGEWIDQINRLQRDYIAEPSEEQVTFPFVGASNLIIPLTAIAYEATLSRTMQKLRALPDLIATKVLDPEKEELNEEIEMYLNQDLAVTNRFLSNVEPAIMELIQLGTGVAQATFEKVTKKGMRKGKSFDVVVSSGSVIKATPITSFLMPFDNIDPQTARWCGEVFWMTPSQIPGAVRDGLFREGADEDIRGFYDSGTPSSDALRTTNLIEDREDRKPAMPSRLEFYLIYTSYCVDSLSEHEKKYMMERNLPFADEDSREIAFIYHRDSQKIVSIYDNPFEDLRRPYRCGNYFPIPFRWAGIGIAKQNEQFQKEVTTQHRQTIDNATIANCRMWKVRKGNQSIQPGEPIIPNKIWFVDEMDDIQTFANQEIYASSYNNENQAVIYSQQRTGVNELTLGMPGVGTPGTATDSMNRIQESQRKNDYTNSNIRSEWLDLLAQDSVCNIRQWGLNMDLIRYSPKGSELEMFFKRPFEEFRKQYLLRVQIVNQNDNMILDRQTMTQFSGLVQQYYTQILPLVQQLESPQITPVFAESLRTAIKSAGTIFVKICDTYGLRDAKKFVIVPPPPLPPSPQPSLPNPSGNPDQGLQPSANGGTPFGPAQPTLTNLSLNAPNLTSIVPSSVAGLQGGGIS